MKLKPVKKLQQPEQQVEEKKTTRKKQENKLPPDGYRPMFEPTRILIRETPSNKDCTKMVKQYLELSVKRFDDDEALPFVWVQMYQESEFYTGYLKGKTVYLPLEMLYDFIDGLNDLSEECDKRHIEQCDMPDRENTPEMVCSFLCLKDQFEVRVFQETTYSKKTTHEKVWGG